MVSEVRRRGADFEALHKLVKCQHPGFFLPQLPDKPTLLGLQSRLGWGAGDSATKVRRFDLQAYIRGVRGGAPAVPQAVAGCGGSAQWRCLL